MSQVPPSLPSCSFPTHLTYLPYCPNLCFPTPASQPSFLPFPFPSPQLFSCTAPNTYAIVVHRNRPSFFLFPPVSGSMIPRRLPSISCLHNPHQVPGLRLPSVLHCVCHGSLSAFLRFCLSLCVCFWCCCKNGFSKAHLQCSKRESEKYKRKGYESFSFLPPHTDLPAPHMFGLQRPAELARELLIRRVTRRVSSLSAGRLRTRGLTRRVFFWGPAAVFASSPGG
jgi:hypothetical protein